MTSGASMESITKQPEPHIRAFWVKQLESDIDLAARKTVPVLITAPPGSATTIVQAIAARSHRDLIPIPTADSVGSDDLIIAIAEDRRTVSTGRGAILWLKDAHRLKPAQQAAVMNLLEYGVGPPHRVPRIIASSSVDLFDLVTAGEFDARLFYRLNAIHIVVQARSD